MIKFYNLKGPYRTLVIPTNKHPGLAGDLQKPRDVVVSDPGPGFKVLSSSKSVFSVLYFQAFYIIIAFI